MKREIVKEKMEAVMKRYFWLAWQAAGGTFGAGWVQDHPSGTEDEVYNNVLTAGDYPGPARSRPNHLVADYVFGRMLKLGIRWEDNILEVQDGKAQIDYQAWGCKYASEAVLLDAAIKEIVGATEQEATA